MGKWILFYFACVATLLGGVRPFAESRQTADGGLGYILAQAERAPAPGRGPARAAGIRQVDFHHFTYSMLAEDRKDYRLPERVTVRYGKAKFGQGGEEVFFEVESVHYGRFTGSREEAALVEAGCGYTSANAWSDDFFLFTETDGHVRCLAAFGSNKLYKDYVRYYPGGILWELKAVRVQNGTINLNYLADGCHAHPAYIATLLYRWNGRTLELTGAPKRRPFEK